MIEWSVQITTIWLRKDEILSAIITFQFRAQMAIMVKINELREIYDNSHIVKMKYIITKNFIKDIRVEIIFYKGVAIFIAHLDMKPLISTLILRR